MKTILYVHDRQESPAATASYLRMAGYRVDLCESSEQCMERLAAGLPNLLLSDVLVEGKHGFELCRAVRRQYTVSQLPIVLASATYRSRIYREEALAAGAQLYHLKPFVLRDLLDSVNELIGSDARAPAARPPEAEERQAPAGAATQS